MSHEEIISSIIEQEQQNGVKIPNIFKHIVESEINSVQEFHGYPNDKFGTELLLQHYGTRYSGKVNIEKLNKIIQLIKEHMNYAPDGQGAQDAKESFQLHAALQTSMGRGRSIKTKRRRRIKRRRPTKIRRHTKRRREIKSLILF